MALFIPVFRDIVFGGVCVSVGTKSPTSTLRKTEAYFYFSQPDWAKHAAKLTATFGQVYAWTKSNKMVFLWFKGFAVIITKQKVFKCL